MKLPKKHAVIGVFCTLAAAVGLIGMVLSGFGLIEARGEQGIWKSRLADFPVIYTLVDDEKEITLKGNSYIPIADGSGSIVGETIRCQLTFISDPPNCISGVEIDILTNNFMDASEKVIWYVLGIILSVMIMAIAYRFLDRLPNKNKSEESWVSRAH